MLAYTNPTSCTCVRMYCSSSFSYVLGQCESYYFRSYCSSLYTSQLWWKYKVNSIGKLYVAYNNAFRMLFMLPRDCSASGMFAVHNVMSCPALVRKLVFGFYKRVKASQNFIVQAICASDIWWKSSIRANWNKLLYVHNAGQGIG